MRSPIFRSARSAFSLLELIVVITIIGIVAAFVIPAATTIVLGTDITRASQMITGQLALARQTAVTKNHAVEVRFLRFADPERPGEKVEDKKTWRFRGIQLMEIFDNGNKALLGKVERYPGSVVMNEGKFSSLLDKSGEAEDKQRASKIEDASAERDAPPLPRVPKAQATKYEYVAFRFLPDGGTNLDPNGKWYVTLYSALDEGKLPQGGPPTINYFTVQVDATNGAVRTFRPTAGKAETGGTRGN
jgi:uncharacterized protein (TIGR02596 family)